ncbi:sigma-70 family RNA polymerase sigma factor [Aquincola sp. J276]|uniref:sigma-70 family RNA polymerase sigma factor n=1 Tax=Aquincola sp. J276 TaxID=2898432 RepID=UPI002150D448|nr:sigma-70 family RNA polymerase sigma factor [Aquincola sp. J276]MCR5867970.1 sigma-70 family RNA polymerase sigma factor [Aquincola sp. J276]
MLNFEQHLPSGAACTAARDGRLMSMDGLSSALIARNTSWVRQEASLLARKLPSNVERADLIQVGLIAVAQSALAFRYEGDHDSEEARQAFVRYARARVRGAMLDELRGMDVLPRAERRRIKVLEIARERWCTLHGRSPSLADLSQACGISIDEVAALEHAAHRARPEQLPARTDDDEAGHLAAREPATPQDEVEARVDTGLLLRRLERFFTKLPETDRQVIDAYLGVGMTPVQLADSLSLSVSRIAQRYAAVCRRIAMHMGNSPVRAVDRVGADTGERFDHLVQQREAALRRQACGQAHWGRMLEDVLTAPDRRFHGPGEDERIVVRTGTRWG